MALVKCPRCELNYMNEGEKYCKVCTREMKGVEDAQDILELCVVCGERMAQAGSDLCAQCNREQKLMDELTDDGDEFEVVEDPADGTLREVDSLEDLELDLDNPDAPPSEIDEIERELGENDDDDEDEEDLDLNLDEDEADDEDEEPYPDGL